jgi:ligand-binding sensor domain-containing protein
MAIVALDRRVRRRGGAGGGHVAACRGLDVWAWDIAGGDPEALWIAVFEHGLCAYVGQSVRRYTARSGFITDYANAVAVDAAGAIWVAGRSAGAIRGDGESWTALRPPGVLRQADAWGIAAGRDGSVLLATNWGAATYRDGAWQTFETDDGLPSRIVTSVAVGPDGAAWLGTASGLARVRGAEWTGLSVRDGLGDQVVRAIAPTRDGGAWVGTEAGVTYFPVLDRPVCDRQVFLPVSVR